MTSVNVKLETRISNMEQGISAIIEESMHPVTQSSESINHLLLEIVESIKLLKESLEDIDKK